MIKKVVTLSYLSAAAPPVLTMAIARTNCHATCSRKEAVAKSLLKCWLWLCAACVIVMCCMVSHVSFVCFVMWGFMF